MSCLLIVLYSILLFCPCFPFYSLKSIKQSTLTASLLSCLLVLVRSWALSAAFCGLPRSPLPQPDEGKTISSRLKIILQHFWNNLILFSFLKFVKCVQVFAFVFLWKWMQKWYWHTTLCDWWTHRNLTTKVCNTYTNEKRASKLDHQGRIGENADNFQNNVLIMFNTILTLTFKMFNCYDKDCNIAESP